MVDDEDRPLFLGAPWRLAEKCYGRELAGKPAGKIARRT
jgi:hypothetical protein